MKKQYSIVIYTLFILMLIISIGATTFTFISINIVITSGIILGIFGFIVSWSATTHIDSIINNLQDQAMHDGMTGLLNYKFFKKRMAEEIERSNRYKNSITLLFFDLDKFKRINDTYGHQFGDVVIKSTCQIISNNVRNIDIVSRYGGEEFCVLLVNAKKEDCLATAERIRSEIESHNYTDGKIKEKMTISIGMAECPENAKDLEEFIKYADDKMYEAKKSGRNCIK